MNRRSILSTLCTGALALLTPLAAFARPYRTARLLNFGFKPFVIGPREDMTPEQIAEFKRLWERDVRIRCVGWRSKSLNPAAMAHGNWQASERECEMLRKAHSKKCSLLVEARDILYEPLGPAKLSDGSILYLGTTTKIIDLLERIEAALKEKI